MIISDLLKLNSLIKGCEQARISQQMSTVEIMHYFQNGFHHGHFVEKNLDFMDFLCISLRINDFPSQINIIIHGNIYNQ